MFSSGLPSVAELSVTALATWLPKTESQASASCTCRVERGGTGNVKHSGAERGLEGKAPACTLVHGAEEPLAPWPSRGQLSCVSVW